MTSLCRRFSCTSDRASRERDARVSAGHCAVNFWHPPARDAGLALPAAVCSTCGRPPQCKLAVARRSVSHISGMHTIVTTAPAWPHLGCPSPASFASDHCLMGSVVTPRFVVCVSPPLVVCLALLAPAGVDCVSVNCTGRACNYTVFLPAANLRYSLKVGRHNTSGPSVTHHTL